MRLLVAIAVITLTYSVGVTQACELHSKPNHTSLQEDMVGEAKTREIKQIEEKKKETIAKINPYLGENIKIPLQ